MPQVEMILAFVFLITICMVDPRHYFLTVLVGLLFLAFRSHRSRFVDGDAADMELGQTLDEDGKYTLAHSVSADLDSSADIDALLSRPPPVTGDDLLTGAMQNVAGKTKEAILARARFTSDNFRRYFQEELDAGEQRHWWEDNSLVAGTVKDGYHHEGDAWMEPVDEEPYLE